jgi:hypothetical protein
MWGGFPRLELEDVGSELDKSIKAYLLDKAET